MKTLISAVILAILFSVSVFPQNTDSTQTRKKETVKKEITKKDMVKKQVQEKETVTARKRHKDVFIDKDGDGICDQRVNGLLFEKLRKRHRTGQHGKGHEGGGGRR
jgi:hypothetical protein